MIYYNNQNLVVFLFGINFLPKIHFIIIIIDISTKCLNCIIVTKCINLKKSCPLVCVLDGQKSHKKMPKLLLFSVKRILTTTGITELSMCNFHCFINQH